MHGCKNRLLPIYTQWFKYSILYSFVILKGIHNIVMNFGVDFKRKTFHANLHPFSSFGGKKVLNQIQEEPLIPGRWFTIRTLVSLIL